MFLDCLTDVVLPVSCHGINFGGYEYLLGMKIWSLTFEKAEELHRQKGEKSDEVKILEGVSPEIIWNNDLDAIEELLDERDETLGIEAKKQRYERATLKNKKQMKKKGMKQKQEDEWDSEQSEIEENSSSGSEDDGSEDEDDLNLIAAKPSPKVKATKPAASKKAPAAMKVDKSSKKRKSIQPDEDSDDGSPAKKSKSTKSTSKKATVKNGNASSKSKRKSSASASAPKTKRASKGKGGKMAISLGISPKLSVKGKKSLDKIKIADSDVDDDLVDSEDDSLPKKVLHKNNKRGLGLSRKSRKGRSTLKHALQEHKESRKRQLEDDSSENNFQKKGRSDSDESSASSDSDESEY